MGFGMRNCLQRCVTGFALVFIAGCVSVPLDSPKEASVAAQDTAHTREAILVAQWLGGRPDVNGFYPLTEGLDAFGARLALMDNAEVSIDAQYFLMKPDEAGLVFAGKLLEAAERGVRVRLLLDDIFTTVDDVDLAMLDSHPNIELRIFNPVARKGVYAFNYLGNFSLANRRMHNKAFIIDNQVAIIGGRNIAVEYFQLETSGEFIDFDMLSAGPIVKDVSAEFDRYWNHQLAVPMDVLFPETESGQVAESYASLEREIAEAGQSIYADAIHTPLMQQFFAHTLDPYLADARLISDDPDKLLQKVSAEQQHVANELREVLLQAESEILIFTPYFIPGDSGVELLRQLNAKGVRIVLVTNSLPTNNHTSVHSAYSGYRKDLLEAGVELWEARADAAAITAEDGSIQLDKLTLHTKGVMIDREQVFVGSLNLDPRSIDINTEMGLLIESPDLGALLASNVKATIPGIAYRLKLDENDNIVWRATIDGREVVETHDPQTTGWERFVAWLLKIVPEGQL